MSSPYIDEVMVPWLSAEVSKTLPVFLVKLIRMLENPALDEMICWDRSGTSFHIMDAPRFCDNVLPHYFKHRNLNSFVRQLNFYGFRKLAAADRATLTQIETPSDDLHFMHPKFIRGRPQLMFGIKRQTNPTKKLTAVSGDKVAPTSAVLDGQFVTVPQQEWIDTNNKLEDLQVRHEELQFTVQSMDKSHDLLFDEIRILREMCKKQSDCFNKLMSYLVTMMNPAKKVHRRPRHYDPYVDHSGENFAITTRNGGDMLALIQKEFQEGLHISKQSVFDEGNKDVHFEYYEPEYYDDGQAYEHLQGQEATLLPPTLERQNNNQQLALTRPKQMYTFASQIPKKEIQGPKKVLTKVQPTSQMSEHQQPSTSYATAGNEQYTYYEDAPLEFLEQRTPPAPGDSPLYLSKIEPTIICNPRYAGVDENGHEQTEDFEEMMDVFDGVQFHVDGDGQEWATETSSLAQA